MVALPSPLALERLGRLRSPAWALAGPVAILIGTFGVLAMPSLATGLAVLAAIATPVLAGIAVVAVVHRRRRALLLVPPALAVTALAGTGLAAQLAASLLTALGCLTLGAAVVRLTPARWLHLGMLSMAAVDVLLLALGVGQPVAAVFSQARSGGHPTFDHAQLGPMTTDYPDLFLAAVLGGVVAGRAVQRRAAALVTILAAASGGFFAVAEVLPATVPLVLVLVLVELAPLRAATGDGTPIRRICALLAGGWTSRGDVRASAVVVAAPDAGQP